MLCFVDVGKDTGSNLCSERGNRICGERFSLPEGCALHDTLYPGASDIRTNNEVELNQRFGTRPIRRYSFCKSIYVSVVSGNHVRLLLCPTSRSPKRAARAPARSRFALFGCGLTTQHPDTCNLEAAIHHHGLAGWDVGAQLGQRGSCKVLTSHGCFDRQSEMVTGLVTRTSNRAARPGCYSTCTA
jgi:hypothetical protein